MRSALIVTTVLAAAASASACSGGSSMASTPTTPTTPAVMTVSIVGLSGNASFVPDPVQVASGGQVMFKNNDTVNTHHIVMDDNSADFGTLPPGATSAAKLASGNFHCSIHPSMVGSINGAVAPTPPPGSGNGY